MIDMSNIKNNLQQLPAKIELATLAYANTAASDLESKAKTEAPWTDRTAQARQRLHGYVEQYDTGVKINLAHGVDYGDELEFGHEKRYAIIKPTIQRNAPKIVSGWQRMVKQL